MTGEWLKSSLMNSLVYSAVSNEKRKSMFIKWLNYSFPSVNNGWSVLGRTWSFGAVEAHRRTKNGFSLFTVRIWFEIGIVETERSFIWFWAHLMNLVVEMGPAIENYYKSKRVLLSTKKHTASADLPCISCSIVETTMFELRRLQTYFLEEV